MENGTSSGLLSNDKILYGKEYEPLIDEEVSLGKLIHFMLSRESNIVLQISDDTGIKYTDTDLKYMSIRVAQNLMKFSIEQEDVVGFVASNTHFLAPVLYGTIYCGVQVNALDPTFEKNDIKHMFGITRPKIIFTDKSVFNNVKQAIQEIGLGESCKIFILSKDVEKDMTSVETLLKPTGTEESFIVPKLKYGSDQTAAIVCSSGSTGLPKGVCLSHKIFVRNTMLMKVRPNRKALTFSTIYWISGITNVFHSAIQGFTRVITSEPFNAKLFLELIEKYQINNIFTPPAQMALTLQCPDIETRDLSSVEGYCSGGSPVAVSISQKMQKYLKNGIVFVGYAMSEVGGVITMEIPPAAMKKGSVGKVFLGIKVKIIDENGKILGAKENGEICVYTGCKWAGYFKNEEATKDTYDNEGWIHTGDLGYYDKEGFVFITGRKKEILKYKLFHFSPNEIESVLLEIPDVIEACVCGIPDLICIDLPAAAIIKKIDSKLSEEEIYRYVEQRMSNFKHLRGGVYFLDDFPRTASGKILRRKVKDIVEKIYNSKSSKNGDKHNI